MKENNRGVELERFADCVTLLKRGPICIADIASHLNVLPESARRWCRVLHDKGHVHSTAGFRNGRPVTFWEWA